MPLAQFGAGFGGISALTFLTVNGGGTHSYLPVLSKRLLDDAAGTTAERPTFGLTNGTIFYDTTLDEYIHWDGAAWVEPIAIADYDGILSTSWKTGGEITVNGGDPALVDIAAGTGMYVDNFTDPDAPVKVSPVTYGPFVGVAMANILTNPFTRLFIDKDGLLVQLTSTTRAQVRDTFSLGEVQHDDNTTITAIAQTTNVPSIGVASSLFDLTQALGDINISGNVFSANGANLSIDKTIGEIYTLWFNAKTSIKDPSVVGHPAITLATFIYTFRDGIGGFTVTTGNTLIGPGVYDDDSVTGAGTVPLGTVANNMFQINRIFLGQANTVIIQYGQATYSSISDAEAAIGSEIFDLNPDLNDVMLRGWLITKGNAVDLTNAGQAKFITAGKFGVSSASVGSGVAAMQPFRDYTPQATPVSHEEGRVYYDDVKKTLATYNEDVDITVLMNHNLITRVINNTASIITKGTPVYLAGVAAGIPEVAETDASATATVRAMGLVAGDLGIGEFGYVFGAGQLDGFDTSAFSVGDTVYVSETVGELTATSPTIQFEVGTILISNATTGAISIKTGKRTFTTTDLVDIGGAAPNDGEALTYVAANNQYEPAAAGGATYELLETVTGLDVVNLIRFDCNTHKLTYRHFKILGSIQALVGAAVLEVSGTNSGNTASASTPSNSWTEDLGTTSVGHENITGHNTVVIAGNISVSNFQAFEIDILWSRSTNDQVLIQSTLNDSDTRTIKRANGITESFNVVGGIQLFLNNRSFHDDSVIKLYGVKL
jgi:hypothetical protein